MKPRPEWPSCVVTSGRQRIDTPGDQESLCTMAGGQQSISKASITFIVHDARDLPT